MPLFTDFTYDPNKAKEILTSDGYDCTSTPCTKGGKPLVVQYSTVSTNTRRTTTQELLQPKAKDAGIQFQIKNYDAGTLFGDIGPHGKYTILTTIAEKYTHNIGYPGTTNAAMDEVFSKYLIPQMFAQVSQKKMSAQDAVNAADRDIKQIYAKWRKLGKI